jgi:hypothetical protein
VIFTKQRIAGMASAFLNGHDPRDPKTMPLHADLSGLGPIYIHVGDHELLLDDSRLLAKHAQQAGPTCSSTSSPASSTPSRWPQDLHPRQTTRSTASPRGHVPSSAPPTPDANPAFGVTAGGLPWKITQGVVTLHTDGLLTAAIAGLVVPPGNKNPVPDLALSVFCNGTRVATTPAVRFTATGNAHVVARVALPKFCPVPGVLVNPATGKKPSNILTGIYIGFDGKA